MKDMALSQAGIKSRITAALTAKGSSGWDDDGVDAIATAIFETLTIDAAVNTTVTVPVGGITGVTPGAGVSGPGVGVTGAGTIV